MAEKGLSQRPRLLSRGLREVEEVELELSPQARRVRNERRLLPLHRVMTGFFRNSWYHHGKFLVSMAIGGSAWAGAAGAHLRMPLAVAGDAFFLSYIAAFALALGRLDSRYLRNRAKVEDEGAAVVSLIILAVVAYTCAAIFAILNDKKSDDPIWFAIMLAGAPLGWFVIQLN
jgi:uncharacterized membrane protein